VIYNLDYDLEMNSLFDQLSRTSRTNLDDNEISSIIKHNYHSIETYEENYGRRLSSLLWQAVGRDKMEYILSTLSSDECDAFLDEDMLYDVSSTEDIAYTFSFIDRYFGGRFSLLSTMWK